MTRYATRECSCEVPRLYGGQKRPVECIHGNRFLSDAQLNPPERTPLRKVSPKRQEEIDAGSPLRKRTPMKRSEPRRDWTLAQAKVEDEGEVCRVCGAPGIERAHILGRKYDQPIAPGSKTLLVLPDRIVPLCGESANRCHQRHDAHELDLLPYLTTEEQAQAILDAGSIVTALHRISPSLELAA